jgi:hypothetical protein
VVHDFQNDIDDVAAIEVVPSILQVMQATTGMGFVAVARVTESAGLPARCSIPSISG